MGLLDNILSKLPEGVDLNSMAEKVGMSADELDKAEPVRVRELFQRFVSRIELRFDHVQRGKRMECPLSKGTIFWNTEMFSCVSRGERI